ncbi:unnamed protein product [Mytilus edulis]|uniref:Fibrinogen C-terminal domain-containing protein n=1 Tax=Mytilus edulis TaxID=6550 RepID=A0A8S3VQA0_MYTED|nr:unnamed protein product [Mytilus edulis]
MSNTKKYAVYKTFVGDAASNIKLTVGKYSGDASSEDPFSIPFIRDKGVPQVAMLDTKTIIRKLKDYIKTLMRSIIRNPVQEEMQCVLKSSLKENLTKYFIRNITLQNMNDILEEQGQKKLFNSVKNEGDSMAIHNGTKFSTIDQDNDLDSGADCARPYGAWWHNHCGASCLNRRFLSNLCWNTLKTYSAKTSVMMLRKLK